MVPLRVPRVVLSWFLPTHRYLKKPLKLLVQLAFAEGVLDWREINEGPAKYEAVTAADIRRVANQYFAESNRSVAVFTRKDDGAAAKAPESAGARPGTGEDR